MQTQQRTDFESADRPVRFYESALCLATQPVVFAARWAHVRAAALAALALIAWLLAQSLWKLLAPPRFSATRYAFVLIGLMGLALLFGP